MPALSNDLVARSPTMADLEAVTALINTCDLNEYGTADHTVEDLHATWLAPRFQLATDAWVVATRDRQIVGYAALPFHKQSEIHSHACVHPAHCGQGIGTYLVRRIEARAHALIAEAPLAAPVTLGNMIASTNNAARQLLTREGYTLARHFWRMEISMDTAPPAPVWPAGILVHTFIPHQDAYAVFTAVDEAFADHWRYQPGDFAEWQRRRIAHPGFDPTLWFLAVHDHTIAGAIVCRYLADNGWVSQLAVRRPWRRQGLGLALLRQAFGEFYRRGRRTVGLHVDAQNLTGATRLYERAGMHIARQSELYEKILHTGQQKAAT